uniref:VDB n=1 Tax=Branchiostoma lanceolatum TaxID=7740 RepID=Q6WEB2_BRALA|nr:VDB [Branchiostoma lanceolatum]
MARTRCFPGPTAAVFVALNLMLTVAQVTAVDVDVGEALALQPGDNANLQCNYTTTQSPSTGSLSWSFNNGSGDVTFYQRLGSTEIPSAGYQGRVTFIGDLSTGVANIRLSNMQTEDSGSYTCSVTVFGDGQDSQSITVTVRGPTTVPPGTTPRATIPLVIAVPVQGWLSPVFECQALWAAILMLAILGSDACGKLDVVKHLAVFGPLVGVALAVVGIILAFVPPNSGNSNQQGFMLIEVLSGVAALMSIVAAIDGVLFKKSGSGVNVPVATMSLEFPLGMMIAIAGTVIPAVYVQQETRVPGIVLGAICVALLVAAFIWFMIRVGFGRKQSSRVSQDFSEASKREAEKEDA